MDLQLNGKTAFISGSTAGIGFEVAKILAREGARVILNGRQQAGVESATKRLQSIVPEANVSGIAADFADKASVQQLINNLSDIDILINNVGIYIGKTFEETTDEDWYKQIEVNLMSGVRLSRHFLPKMKSNGWGRILFVSSECATLIPDDLFAYSITKTAMLGLSRGLAQQTKGTAVTVNTIIPGSTLTEGAIQFLETAAKKENKTAKQVELDFFTEIRTSSLLQRFAKVEEVANTIVYLASPLSSATNGTAIKVDGGSMGGII